MRARRERLEAAGIDPAHGGAFGQYAGNLWRDFWLDQDNARTARRSSTNRSGGAGAGWFARARAAFDAELQRRADNWRTRPTAGQHDTDRSSPGPDLRDRTGPGRNAPEPAAADEPDFDEADFEGVIHDSDEYNIPSGNADTEPPRGAVRVPATVGEPAGNTPRTATAVLDPPPAPAEPTEGNIPMTNAVATRGIHVTGVVSGAAETLSIHNETQAAIHEFQERLRVLSNRMVNLGESTLTIVQFSGGSSVVLRMAQAAEALAALRASATQCGGEVLPLLVQTRNEFTRRNS